MINLTKLFCDLISTGCTINEADASQIAQHVAGLAHHMLPDGFWVNVDDLEEHIENLQLCRRNAEQKMVNDARGADFDIDDVRNRLAQGKPVSIKRITEFHNKLSITLSDGKELSFNTMDVVHY